MAFRNTLSNVSAEDEEEPGRLVFLAAELAVACVSVAVELLADSNSKSDFSSSDSPLSAFSAALFAGAS